MSSPVEPPEIKLEQMSPRSPSTNETEKGYDLVAAEYTAQFSDELADKPFDQKMLDLLLEKCPGNTIVCDMGCGPAQVARYLKSRGARVCGFDISAAMIAHAQTLDPELKLERHSMLDLSAVPDSSLGAIAAFYSIIHVPRSEVANVLSEFKRLLTPGGALLLTFHIGNETVHRDEWWGHEVDIDFNFFQTDEMKHNLSSAGFVLDEVIERGPYPSEYPSRRAYLFAHRE